MEYEKLDFMELSIIQKHILEIRGQRVMLDFRLAEMYGVETRILIQAVKRNINRFPPDFVFQLNKSEFDVLISQIVISKTEKRGGTRKLPYVFTEHGITMLSSVLRSETAIKVNIAVVRAFILLKQHSNDFRLLQKRINELESKFNRKIENINEVIDILLSQPEPKVKKEKPIKKIGYKLSKNKK